MGKKSETSKALDDVQDAIDELRKSLGLETSVERKERLIREELAEYGIQLKKYGDGYVFKVGRQMAYFNKSTFE